MEKDAALRQIDELLKVFELKRAFSKYPDLSEIDMGELIALRTRIEACIERLVSGDNLYYINAQKIKNDNSVGSAVVMLSGILSALRDDIVAGYLTTVRELIHASLFDDFLDTASELLDKGYKAPAAVVAGTVLEEHMRKLALKSGIEILDGKAKPKKFEIVSVDLVKAGKFSEPQRKILAGYYAQRSEAAHGRYENVVETEVKRMIEGIRDFIVRYPA